MNDISQKTKKIEETLVWFIQEIVRGNWFRRIIFILVTVMTLMNPPVAARVFSFLRIQAPSWYTVLYCVIVGLLLVLALIVGMRTLPRRETTTEPPLEGTVRGLNPFNKEDSELFARL